METEQLTEKQIEELNLLLQGMSSKDVALNLSGFLAFYSRILKVVIEKNFTDVLEMIQYESKNDSDPWIIYKLSKIFDI